jgi:hypothetical protein
MAAKKIPQPTKQADTPQPGHTGKSPRQSASSTTPLAIRFPLLSQQPGLPSDIAEDLTSTDTAFGTRHKRGKAARLKVLEDLENRLELTLLRARADQSFRLMSQLNETVSAFPDGLGVLLTQPVTHLQAETALRLSFLVNGRSGPEFSLDPTEMCAAIEEVASDGVAQDILRKLILNIEDTATAQTLADDHGLGRQAIYDRQNRMVSRLDRLVSSPSFVQLSRHLLTTACAHHASHIEVSLKHPLAAVLLLPKGDFASVWDVVATGLWAIARTETRGRRSFSIVTRSGETCLELQRG